MNCWKCGVPLEFKRKISFREVCDTCGMSLHCCKNCKYYAPGRPNDCAIPGTDYVPDREANNFCEEFSLLGLPPPSQSTEKKQKFDDLFR